MIFEKLINKEYDKRFSKFFIEVLSKKGCTAKFANKYDMRFKSSDINILWKKGCSPQIANKYKKKFSAEDIINLWERNISPKYANQFEHDFPFVGYTIDDIINAYEKNFPIKIVRKFNRRFGLSSRDILIQVYPNFPSIEGKNSVTSYSECNRKFGKKKDISKYNKRFTNYARKNLFLDRIPSSIANNFNPQLEFYHIDFLYNQLHLKPDGISFEKQKNIANIFDKIYKSLNNMEGFTSNGIPIELLGTGKSGVVFRQKNAEMEDYAFKYSEDIQFEYDILNTILKYHGKLKNIIEVENGIFENVAIKFKFRRGITLESFTNKYKGKISDVIKVGGGIMNALIEMRSAGVWYHRDIRPANIFIYVENDTLEVKLLDFGCATKDKHAQPIVGNRRFNGWNDLVSLGQLMYFMATGEHIFAKSKSMSMTLSDVSDQINDYRNLVYSDKTGELLRGHLKQIDRNIQDPRLRVLIKSCLTAKNSQYGKMNKLFNLMNSINYNTLKNNNLN